MHSEVEIMKEGWMKKRGSRVKTMWGERYFVLRGNTIYYYLKATDTVRGT
jgi:PH domain